MDWEDPYRTRRHHVWSPVMQRLFESIPGVCREHLHVNNVGREVIDMYSNRDLWLRRLSQMNNTCMTVDTRWPAPVMVASYVAQGRALSDAWQFMHWQSLVERFWTLPSCTTNSSVFVKRRLFFTLAVINFAQFNLTNCKMFKSWFHTKRRGIVGHEVCKNFNTASRWTSCQSHRPCADL